MRASMVSPTTTLNSLPLPPSALELLAATDFVTVADLDGLTAQDLAEELSSSERPVTTEHAARLLLMVRSGGFGDDAHMARRPRQRCSQCSWWSDCRHLRYTFLPLALP